MSIFASLENEWRRMARAQAAQEEASSWAAAEPDLLCTGIEQLVSRVTWEGFRTSSEGAAILSALLRLAGSALAARALLQALLPRIRLERVATPTYGHGVGETWPRPSDTTADLVAECFASIKRHAGEHHRDVARLVIAESARRLRTARQGQRRWHSRTTAAEAAELSVLVSGDMLEARSGPEWLAAALFDAVRAGRLGPREARILYAARVKGLPASEVGRQEGLGAKSIYYALAQAERAFLSSLSSPTKAA